MRWDIDIPQGPVGSICRIPESILIIPESQVLRNRIESVSFITASNSIRISGILSVILINKTIALTYKSFYDTRVRSYNSLLIRGTVLDKTGSRTSGQIRV